MRVKLPDAPNGWTDGSLVLDEVSAASSSGSGFFCHIPGICWGSRWGTLMTWDVMVGGFSHVEDFSLCLVPFRPVQRAELWGVILALQASDGTHLGDDDLNVVRQVGRLVGGNRGSCPVELNDGDLILLIDRMLAQRSRASVDW